jgi:itaconyl-CoA hydratase
MATEAGNGFAPGPQSLTGRDNYFEDFNPGDLYEHARGKTVGEIDNVLITNLVMNTAQGHFNEHMMESSPQKHRIVFGGVTASIVIGLAMQDTGENAIQELGLDKVRFRVPVLHGDTLYAFSEVLGKDDSPEVLHGHKDVGAVHFRHWGINQRGETVFEGVRRVLVKKRSFSTAELEVEDEAPAAMPAARRVPARATKTKARAVKAHARSVSAKARSVKGSRPVVAKSAKDKSSKALARRKRK